MSDDELYPNQKKRLFSYDQDFRKLRNAILVGVIALLLLFSIILPDWHQPQATGCYFGDGTQPTISVLSIQHDSSSVWVLSRFDNSLATNISGVTNISEYQNRHIIEI